MAGACSEATSCIIGPRESVRRGDYQKLLRTFGIRSSMRRKGNCYDNAVMESFLRTLKVECVYLTGYETRREAKSDLFDYIERFYNTVRLHSSLGYVSPLEYERRSREKEPIVA